MWRGRWAGCCCVGWFERGCLLGEAHLSTLSVPCGMGNEKARGGKGGGWFERKDPGRGFTWQFWMYEVYDIDSHRRRSTLCLRMCLGEGHSKPALCTKEGTRHDDHISQRLRAVILHVE